MDTSYVPINYSFLANIMHYYTDHMFHGKIMQISEHGAAAHNYFSTTEP